MDELTRKADHRLLAMDETSKLQAAIGLDDKWKGIVENSIYTLIEEGYRRGATYGWDTKRFASSPDQ